MGRLFASNEQYATSQECLRIALELDPDDKETGQLLMDALETGATQFLGQSSYIASRGNRNGFGSKGTIFPRDDVMRNMQVADAEGAKPAGLAM